MSDLQTVTELSNNPLTLFAGALLFTAGTAFVRELKKPKGTYYDQSATTQQLNHLQQSFTEINVTLKEVCKMLAETVSQGEDNDDCQDNIKRELEGISRMAVDLVNMHNNPNSIFATINLYDKFDKLIEKQNNLELLIAKLK